MVSFPVCSDIQNKVWGIRNSHTIYECLSCKVAFFDCEKTKKADYQNYHCYADRWEKSDIDYELRIRRNKIKKQLAHIGKYSHGKKLLDIGAGFGYYCKVACEEGWDARAVEVSAPAVSIGKKFLDTHYAELKDVSDESIDVISCHHVLEHIDRPAEFIQNLSSKLKHRGILVIHTPHREPLSFLLRNLIAKYTHYRPGMLCSLYMPEHVLGFTKESLTNALKLFGFTPIEVKKRTMWSAY